MASSARIITEISCPTGAVTPEIRAATTNSDRCPARVATESTVTLGQVSRVSSPSRTSASVAAKPRRHFDVLWIHFLLDRKPNAVSSTASTSTVIPAAATTSLSIGGTIGWNSTTTTADAISTICPAVRSSTTARTPRGTSPEDRPCSTARWTSPSTPAGRTPFRNSAR